ncbi:FTR1 family protein [Sphingosinithalassobacter sp. LHW66-3]|uniref:FTR1 family protein n=1 Tax=Sphingosinithalassobacter sp. LHW66-3 TaxID=3424718 RepID=UPI003D6A386E
MPDRSLPSWGRNGRVLVLIVVLLLSVVASGAARAGAPGVATTWRMLDYVAVDYGAAVTDGKVSNQFEYDEMIEFSASVAERIGSLPASRNKSVLQERARELREAIAAKRPAGEVAQLARSLAAALLAEHPVPLAPSEAPDLTRATTLFAQNCAACHGSAGESPPSQLMDIDPPPIDFTDQERAQERSAFGLYQVITQGLEGTTMPSFASLQDQDRWALALYAGGIAFTHEAEGQRIWEENAEIRRLVPDLEALVALTPAALAQQIGEDRAFAVMAYLRANPQIVATAEGSGSLDFVRQKLRESLAAYERGDRAQANEFALSAYLDGFEPLEAVLSTRDGDLMLQVEQALSGFRASINSGVRPGELRSQLREIYPLLDRAETASSPEAATDISTFLGAFTILLREGLEALLVVIAMIAFVRKSERTEVMPYVHGGWISALLAGVATWAAATYFVTISGASRELTEGFGALLAAVVLVSVGIWMHGKSQADEWRRYIQEKMGKALSRRSAWFLFGLAFVVVYREVFETILFYAALWNPQNSGTILAGALSALVVLAVLAWIMLRYSRKLPITQFFRYSAWLVAVLAVVLAGKGIGALQEAGMLGVTLLEGLPRVDLIGFYPAVEPIAAQVITAGILFFGFRSSGGQRRAAAMQA